MNVSNATSSSSPMTISFAEQCRDAIILFLYLITAIVAIIGNVFVCRVIYIKKQMRSTTYMLIASMAISDILGGVMIVTQWFFCSYWFLEFGILADLSCGLQKTLQILSYFVSTYSMTAIAIDRYRLIMYPFKPPLKPIIPIVITWGLGILFNLPTLIALRISKYFTPNEGIISCGVILGSNSKVGTFSSIAYLVRQSRVAFNLTTQYAMPLAITGYLYGIVMYTVWQRERVGTVSDRKKQELDKTKRNTIKMLIIVVLLFAIAWFPTYLMHFLKFYSNIIPLTPGKCSASTFYLLCYWLSISSCSYNPFIYCYFNTEFKNEAIRYWNIIIKAKDQPKGERENELESGETNQTSTTFSENSPRIVSTQV